MDNPWQLCQTIGPLLSQRFPLASAKARSRGDLTLSEIWILTPFEFGFLDSPLVPLSYYSYLLKSMPGGFVDHAHYSYIHFLLYKAI